VLIVDDYALMRKYLREIIAEDRELEVEGAARDGQEAVQLLDHGIEESEVRQMAGKSPTKEKLRLIR